MTIAVSLNHASSIVTWAMRVANHPELGPWLLDDVHRFAAFYAVLNGRMEWPERLTKAVAGKKGSGKITVKDDPEAYEEWRKNPDHPFHGRLNPRFLEAFWKGTVVHRFTQHSPTEWQEILGTVAREWRAHQDESDDHLQKELHRLTQAMEEPSVAPVAPTGVGVVDRTVRLPRMRNVMTLFALNGLFINKLMNFTDAEMELMELAFLLREDESFRMWWELMTRDAHEARAVMQAMLDLGTDAMDALTDPEGPLATSQLVTFAKDDRVVQPMSGFWHRWFSEPVGNEGELFEKLVVPLRKQANAGALGRVNPDDRGTIDGLLNLSPEEEKGLNLLLYGPKSIDKTGFVADLLTEHRLEGFTLATSVPDTDLTSACYVVQRYLARIAPNAVLVLPKADGVLARTQRGTRQLLFFAVEIDDEVADSATERELLLENPVKTIWLVNSPERLSEENLGRFLYTCEVKTASRSERRAEVEEVLGDMGLSPSFIADLSQHTRLGEQQLRSAARLATLLVVGENTPTVQRGQRETLVRRAIEQSQKALNRREREDLRQPITEYSLDLLNVSGSFTVHQIIESLKKRPQASLCFWGIPGTGKTQLAEHIAVMIDKPILIKRASDLLDKYLGESEKRIRAMFTEASDEDAILLLDEADTFLRDRSLARYNHEMAMVNELLQGMERFRGVFICTTNLFSSLDAASLRRFTFKLEFRALKPEQRWRMFVTEARINEATLSEEQKQAWIDELTFMQYLAPGDFATVKKQCRLLDLDLSPEQWIQQLKQEMRAKSHQITPGIHGAMSPDELG